MNDGFDSVADMQSSDSFLALLNVNTGHIATKKKVTYPFEGDYESNILGGNLSGTKIEIRYEQNPSDGSDLCSVIINNSQKVYFKLKLKEAKKFYIFVSMERKNSELEVL